jgi:hypothetical protein
VLLKADPPQPVSHAVAARQPDSPGQSDSEERDEQEDGETGGGEHPGEQEPEPRERENSTAQLVTIDRLLEPQSS